MDKKNLEKVIFICGAPHSGSTLLGLILGSHSHSFYAGEANKTKFLRKQNLKNHFEDKACKVCGKECPIWGDFSLSENKNLYHYLAEKSKKSIIIDSTKNIKWLKKQISKIDDSKIEKILIYLCRDGRAIINSRLRKYKESKVEDIIKDWKEHIVRTNRFYERFPSKKIKIHYENLATNPENVIKNICSFLGIKYENKMLTYYQFNHHPLGGNTGTQSLLQNLDDSKSLVKLSERNRYYYGNHPLDIKLDLRWKQELSLENQELFKKLTGNLNEEFIWI